MSEPTSEMMSKRENAKAARRRLIVEAAMVCFVEQGIHQTGIRDIAKQANVSLGNLYNHFAGKSELITEIAVLEGRDVSQYVELLESHGNPVSGILQFADHYLEHVSHPDVAILSFEIMV